MLSDKACSVIECICQILVVALVACRESFYSLAPFKSYVPFQLWKKEHVMMLTQS